MSSTEFTVGLLDGARNSSKVLKPPGGGSSDIFHLGEAEKAKPQKDFSNTQNRLFGDPIETNSTVVRTPAKSNTEWKTNPLRSVKKSYVRRNPITGEVTEIFIEKNMNDEDVKEDKDVDKEVVDEGKKTEAALKPVQTSIRVRNPPGGKSSGIF